MKETLAHNSFASARRQVVSITIFTIPVSDSCDFLLAIIATMIFPPLTLNQIRRHTMCSIPGRQRKAHCSSGAFSPLQAIRIKKQIISDEQCVATARSLLLQLLLLLVIRHPTRRIASTIPVTCF